MKEEKKKLINIGKSIINDKKDFLNLLYDYRYYYLEIQKIFFDMNNSDVDNRAIKYYSLFFSLINYNKLNMYCGCGNFPKDEYIFHRFYEKHLINNEIFNNIINDLIIDLDIINKEYNSFIIFILFSTNEEIYNKSFKDKLRITRNQLMNYILKHTLYITDEDLKILIRFAEKSYFYKLTFQGDFFLDFKNIIYYLIFTNDFNEDEKIIIFNSIYSLFIEILDTIKYILFLPLYNIGFRIFEYSVYKNNKHKMVLELIKNINDKTLNYNTLNYKCYKYKINTNKIFI